MADAKPSTPRAATRLGHGSLPYSGQCPADLAPKEYAEIVRLVRSAIDAERYVLSPRVKRLKSILAKLDPAPSATVTPYPPPRPSAEPSHLYAKLRGVRRRR